MLKMSSGIFTLSGWGLTEAGKEVRQLCSGDLDEVGCEKENTYIVGWFCFGLFHYCPVKLGIV